MGNFSLSLKNFAELTDKKMDEVFRTVAFKLSDAIISDTPVDTGRARNNWFPEIGSYSNSTTEEVDKTGSKAKSNVKSVTSRLKGGQTFTLSNNLDYIVPLEYGLSKQNRAGMVRSNILKFSIFLNEANRSVK